MGKIDRQLVYDKFGGLCAFTGKPLGVDWEVDHVLPRSHWQWLQRGQDKQVDDLDNLLPAIRIVNHYKRDHGLESFRMYMLGFHQRLSKLPKKTQRPQTARRIAYMQEIARLFDIAVDRPFAGKFYFETISANKM